ncbi:MAG TPA: NAD(P)/FAD-dependent oxidoreductase [Caulobacteraceae bacterium]|nr:NAD(P)/FAD-dependent oxidoreductase [Caulobacteraceae bacterium]
MAEFDFDACVVGAGAVGLACAHALAGRGLSVVVLEKERAIGQGVSSRNSEVIHAGLYYPTGSLKARLCVAGRRALYPFLEAHKIDFRKCGKLVVAQAGEEPRLAAIYAQARANGVEGVEQLTGADAIALEPGLRAAAAILSPESGVFDSHGYMVALAGEIEDRGGAVALAAPFEGATPLGAGEGFSIHAGGAAPTRLATRLLVTAPGLGAQAVAARVEGFPAAAIPPRFLGKGVYFRLRGRAPFERLIYPPPIAGALGTHYRRDLGGQAIFGPDLAFVETEDYLVDPARAEGFYAYVRRFWPGLPDGALAPDYAGLRPKIHGPGDPQPDFRIDGLETHGLAGLVALFGIESPGLTASLAIGEEVAGRLAGWSPPALPAGDRAPISRPPARALRLGSSDG